MIDCWLGQMNVYIAHACLSTASRPVSYLSHSNPLFSSDCNRCSMDNWLRYICSVIILQERF